jgi:predicted nucleic acid-binding protein
LPQTAYRAMKRMSAPDTVRLFFVDTNVLLYALDPADAAKNHRARSWMTTLWEHKAGRLSWQVLNEYYANARKVNVPLSVARSNVETLALWDPVGFGLGVLHRAWYWTDKTAVPYWDALVLAAAETAACVHVLTEDFQAGQKFGDLTIVNPFRTPPDQFFAE